jgi:hypothetical protein
MASYTNQNIQGPPFIILLRELRTACVLWFRVRVQARLLRGVVVEGVEVAGCRSDEKRREDPITKHE